MTRAGSRISLAALAGTVGFVVAAIRFLSTIGFPNDHFVALSRAAQMLYGELPVRDFVDPGMPLTYAVSAAGLWIGGPTLYPEAMLVSSAFGVAAAATVWMIAEWCGSLLLALWAAALEFAVFPRSYSYPKILLHALVALLMLAYVRRPSTLRATAIALVAVVAFLFRHDHGLFIAVAGFTLVTLVGASKGGPRVALRSGAIFAAMTIAFATPYLLFVELNGGLGRYLQSAIEFSRLEADRTVIRGWPALHVSPWSTASLSPAGYYLFWILPAVAGLSLFYSRASLSRREQALVVAMCLLAVAVNAGYLREPLDARIPDAIVPAVLVGSWLAARAWNRADVRVAWVTRPLVALALTVVLIAGAQIGALAEQLDRANIKGGINGVARWWSGLVAELQEPYNPRHMPSAFSEALRPFFAYVHACTAPYERLLVTGAAPEVPFYARRAFAGGHVNLFSPYYSSTADQRLLLRRLSRESVPLVVVPPESVQEFAAAYPLLHQWVSWEYTLMAEVKADGQDDPGQIYIRRDLAASPAFDDPPWPCPTRRT